MFILIIVNILRHCFRNIILCSVAEVFWTNWGPDYRYSEKLDQNFFSVFAIFFPSGECFSQ